MKKSRNALLLTLCVFVLCGMFTACDTLPSVAELNQAIERTKNLDDIAAKVEIQIDMDMIMAPISIPLTAEVKASGLKGEDPIYYSKVTSDTTVFPAMDVELYKEKNWAYVVMGDVKYKTRAGAIGAEYDFTDDVKDVLQELPTELLKGLDFTENSDGSKTISIFIEEEEFIELYANIVEDTGVSLNALLETVGFTDAIASVTIKDGYVLEYAVLFTMNVMTQGMESGADVSFKVTYRNPGEDVIIIPPEGYQEFAGMENPM